MGNWARGGIAGAAWVLLGGCGQPPPSVLRIADLAVDGGSETTAVELARLTMPAIGGARLEARLPAGVPPEGTFETRLALAPSRPGTAVRFRAVLHHPGGQEVWLDRVVEGGLGHWVVERRRVALEPGGRLWLETVPEGPTPVAPGAVRWGNPSLLFDAADGATNLVVVVVDTLRADTLEPYGGAPWLAPSLGRLAAASLRWEDLVAPAPWTLPSVATLMTGLHPQTHGAGRRLSGPDEATPRLAPLADGVPTLAGILSEAGFLTAGFYSNVFLEPPYGLHQGFDHYRGFPSEARAERIVDETIDWLRLHRERRFFLFVHLFDPHSPYAPPAADCRRVAERLVPRRPGFRCREARSLAGEGVPADRRPWARALYHAEVASTDRQIGRLLAVLEELDLAGRTAVLFVSDHGEELWERQPEEESRGYDPRPGHGHTHYDELLRLPGFLRLPGVAPRTVEAPAEAADLLPTLLAWLEVDGPPVQGRDLTRALAGGTLPEPVRIADFLLHGRARWAARQGPWKVVVAEDGGQPPELYHLLDDPGETTDRFSERSGEARRLLAVAVALRAARSRERQERGFEEASSPQLDETSRDRLRALGYVR